VHEGAGDPPHSAEDGDGGLDQHVLRFDDERKAAKGWAESYDDSVHDHFETAEQFERAQLVAEIGIVLASIGLLLRSRPFWYISLAAAVGSVALVGITYVHGHGESVVNEHKIEVMKEKYQEKRNVKDDSGQRLVDVRDAQLLDTVRERFGIEKTESAAEKE
jgi:hypothetical protein